MLDVFVTCLPVGEPISSFPEVRGHYLAKHLARAGLRAEFRPLPQPAVRCEVLICSGYQASLEWFEKHLADQLGELAFDRAFCMLDYSLGGRDHFSRGYRDWFVARGGALFHGIEGEPEPGEHWIGVGVDTDVVPGPAEVQDAVLFDLPKTDLFDCAEAFDVEILDAVRRRFPGARLGGAGAADARVRTSFDRWAPYGQRHGDFVAQSLNGVFAFVPGRPESFGLGVAEAQVAGACVLAAPYEIKEWVLCSEATVGFQRGDVTSLLDAMDAALDRDPDLIAAQARTMFDFGDVVARTRAAIEL